MSRQLSSSPGTSAVNTTSVAVSTVSVGTCRSPESQAILWLRVRLFQKSSLLGTEAAGDPALMIGTVFTGAAVSVVLVVFSVLTATSARDAVPAAATARARLRH